MSSCGIFLLIAYLTQYPLSISPNGLYSRLYVAQSIQAIPILQVLVCWKSKYWHRILKIVTTIFISYWEANQLAETGVAAASIWVILSNSKKVVQYLYNTVTVVDVSSSVLQFFVSLWPPLLVVPVLVVHHFWLYQFCYHSCSFYHSFVYKGRRGRRTSFATLQFSKKWYITQQQKCLVCLEEAGIYIPS